MNNKHYLLIGLTLLFLFITRTWSLPLLPAALTHDELVYAVQAKSLAVQGTYLNQRYGPLSLQPAHPMYAELPALLMAPFYLVFNNPLVAARMMPVLMGIALPLILGWLSFGIFKNRPVSLLVMIFAAANPLLWQLSRLGYDAVFSSFFYLLAGAVVLNFSGKKSLLSLPLFILGFFQYQGFKLLLVPWIMFLLGILIMQQGKRAVKKLNFIVTGLATLILVVYVGLILPHQEVADRWQQTIFADSEYQASHTNDQRRSTLNNPAKTLVSNKVTAVTAFMVDRIMSAYSPKMLFLDGEPAQSGFAAWGYGWFHAADALLLLIGIGYMCSQKTARKYAIPLALIMAIAALPTTVNSGASWHLLRMFFSNVLLLMFIGWGGYWFWQRRLGKAVLVAVYSVSILLFMYHYYFRYPILSNHIGYLSERQTVEYIKRTKKINPETKFFIHTVDPPVMFWTYLVYADAITPETVNSIAAAAHEDEFIFDNITFTGTCADVADTQSVILTESYRLPCDYSQSKAGIDEKEVFELLVQEQSRDKLSIPSILDNGAHWRIYNDRLCKDYGVPGFVHIQSLSQFDIDNQPDNLWCRTWLTNVE